jgi:hypothetical protein
VAPVLVVKPKVRPQAPYGISDDVVLFEIHLLVFHRAPQALNEDVVKSSALSVHADRYTVGLQDAGKTPGRELGPLVRIENLGLGKVQSRMERFDAKLSCGVGT